MSSNRTEKSRSRASVAPATRQHKTPKTKSTTLSNTRRKFSQLKPRIGPKRPDSSTSHILPPSTPLSTPISHLQLGGSPIQQPHDPQRRLFTSSIISSTQPATPAQTQTIVPIWSLSPPLSPLSTLIPTTKHHSHGFRSSPVTASLGYLHKPSSQLLRRHQFQHQLPLTSSTLAPIAATTPRTSIFSIVSPHTTRHARYASDAHHQTNHDDQDLIPYESHDTGYGFQEHDSYEYNQVEQFYKPMTKTVHLEEGVDYMAEVGNLQEIYTATHLDQFMARVMDLPLSSAWPRTAKQAAIHMDDSPLYSPIDIGDHEPHPDHSEQQQTTHSTPPSQSQNPTPHRKKAQFSEGVITATQEEFEEQQRLANDLAEVQMRQAVDIELNSDMSVVISTIIQQIVNCRDGDVYVPMPVQESETNPTQSLKQKHILSQLPHNGTLQSEDLKVLQHAFPHSAKFLTELGKLPHLTPLTTVQSLIIDLMISNTTIPATTIARHLTEYLADEELMPDASVPAAHFIQQAYNKGRLGLTNAISVISLASCATLTIDLVKADETAAQKKQRVDVGSHMFRDPKQVKLLRLQQEQLAIEQNAERETTDGIDVTGQELSTAPSIFNAGPFATKLKIISAPQSTQTSDPSSPTNAPITSIATLTNQTNMTFHHNVPTQQYSLMLHSIIDYFQAPAHTRKSLLSYEGFPDTLEDIVGHGYRLCALMMHPEYQKSDPSSFYLHFPLILSFFLTCQDQAKFDQTLLYFQENIAADYSEGVLKKHEVNNNYSDLLALANSPAERESILSASRTSGGQYNLDAIAINKTRASNFKKKRMMRDRAQFIEAATQTIELVLARHFVQKDYTNIFHIISWAETSGLFPPFKMEAYRNRLYAQSDDQSFISLINHRFISIAQHEASKSLQGHLNDGNTNPALQAALTGFYQPLFTVLPPHPTLSSLSATLRNDYGQSVVKRLEADTIMDTNAQEVLSREVQFLSLPKPIGLFLNDLLTGPKGFNRNQGPSSRHKQYYQQQREQYQKDNNVSASTNFDTLSQVILHDINPNVIKIDPHTGKRFIDFPKFVTAADVVKFHQIAFKIQHHAIKIRQRLEHIFPELTQIGHYHSPHYPHITINGQNHYLTSSIDPELEQRVHEAQLNGTTDSLPPQDLAAYQQQVSYNTFIQNNVKELWVKHITPPMFRILDKNEIGILHLYSLCEPIIQSSAVNATPTVVRRPPQSNAAPPGSRSASETAKNEDQFNSLFFSLRLQNISLGNFADIFFSPNPVEDFNRLRHQMEHSTGGPVENFLPQPQQQLTHPVLPDQSLFSQFPVAPKVTTIEQLVAQSDEASAITKIPSKLATRQVIPLQSPDNIAERVSKDAYALVSTDNTAILAYSVTSNLYLIRRTYENMARFCNTKIIEGSRLDEGMVNVIQHVFANTQKTQFEMLRAGFIQAPYDTTGLKSLIRQVGAIVTNEPLSDYLDRRPFIPLKPLKIVGETGDFTKRQRQSDIIIAKHIYSQGIAHGSDGNVTLAKSRDINAVLAEFETSSVKDGGEVDVEDGGEGSDNDDIPTQGKNHSKPVRGVVSSINLQGRSPIVLQHPLPTQLETVDLISTLGHKSHKYDITQPLTTDEIAQFNEIYEQSHYNPERDALWTSHIPILSRIMALTDFSSHLGGLNNRTTYSHLVTQAYQSSLPDLAVKLLNQQQLYAIPYIAPQAFVPSIISLLECGQVGDARAMVRKMDLKTTPSGVITTVARLASNAKEYSIPMYFLRSYIANIKDYIHGNGPEPLQDSTNLFLLSNLLRYVLPLLVPEPRSPEAVLYKFHTSQQPNHSTHLQLPTDQFQPFTSYVQLAPSPDAGLDAPSTSSKSNSQQQQQQQQQQQSDVTADNAIDQSQTTPDSMATVGLTTTPITATPAQTSTQTKQYRPDLVLATLELGLELQQSAHFFTLLTKPPTSDSTATPPRNENQARLGKFKASMNSTGVIPRDVSRLLLIFVQAAQLIMRPDLERYFRGLIHIVDPEFSLNSPRNSHSAIDVQHGLDRAGVDRKKAGVVFVNPNAKETTGSKPAESEFVQPRFQKEPVPITAKGLNKKLQKFGSAKGVDLSSLDRF